MGEVVTTIPSKLLDCRSQMCVFADRGASKKKRERERERERGRGREGEGESGMRRRMSMARGNSDDKDAMRMATLFNPNKPAVKVKGGWMDKAGEKNTAWKRRWFELVDHDTLTYTSEPGGKPKGAIDLHLCHNDFSF